MQCRNQKHGFGTAHYLKLNKLITVMKKILTLITILSLTCIQSLFAVNGTIRYIGKGDAMEFAQSNIFHSGPLYYFPRHAVPDSLQNAPYWPSSNGFCRSIYVPEEPLSNELNTYRVYLLPSSAHINTLNSNLPYTIAQEDELPSSAQFLCISSLYEGNDTMHINVPMSNDLISQEDSITASHIHVVIISGGWDKYNNHTRYWNDCSYIYQTLVNKYHVPKSNFHIFISNGTSLSKDQISYPNGFVKSSRDFDFDGDNETVFAAYKTNITNKLTTLSSQLTRDDNLFIYVIDHGGTNDNNGSSYICLWNHETLKDTELASLLNNFNVNSINVVLGQCYSGGFIDNLTAPGRVIVTACDKDESSWACTDIPYDEFVYQWTSAINEAGHTGSHVLSDTNNDSHVSLLEAYNYAAANDRAYETPQKENSPKFLEREYSFNSVPYVADTVLFVRDSIDDVGTEPYYEVYNFWNSPDIWVRNQPDGFVNQTHENPNVSNEDEDMYVYVRVHNRGKKPYTLQNQYLHLYWANAAFGLNTRSWRGVQAPGGSQPSGGHFSPKPITATIPPNSSAIIQFREIVPYALYSQAQQSGGYAHACLLARISPEELDTIDGETGSMNYLGKVREYRTIAQKNLTIIYSSISATSQHIPIIARNTKESVKNYNLEILPSPRTRDLFNKAEISLELTDSLYNSWVNEGQYATNITSYPSNPKKLYINKGNSKIRKIKMQGNQSGLTYFTYNPIACEIADTTEVFEVNLIQRDEDTGEIIGGETFQIIQEPRPALLPEISYSYEGGHYIMEASNISEEVNYQWYDEGNNLVGTQKQLSVSANRSGDNYRLRVQSKKDGAVNYANVQLNKMSVIKSVAPSPFVDYFTVSLSNPASAGMHLKVTSVATPQVMDEVNILEGETEITLYTSQYLKGAYIVSLCRGNSVIESKTIIK